MTDAEKREAARQFHNKWVGKGKEDEDDRSYWIDFLQDVMGIDHVTDRIEFQKKVVGPDGNTKRIDAYIPETHVLIEQKSLNIDLSKPQPGHNNMTPYEQAKMYDNSLPVSEKAKWIILSNFAEIWVYDMDTRVPEPAKFTLDDIPSKYSLFDFLINQDQTKISQEMEISVKAGEFVGLIYDALLKQYINPENEESLKSLNMLCVRLVFCLYAEDAHIFGENGHMFHDYMEQFETKDMRKALIELFKILDTPEDKRDPYDTSDLSKFPYVNGGLFADENIEIPNFTEEIRNILLAKASEGFDWSMISPTIFGAVFESTLNPETRRSGGMHYTSIENIHKVIDPLFLDDLKAELDEIKSIQVLKTRNAKLKTYQNKLASLTWLDPACGSGNFLTETYISIRRLENDVISTLKGGQISFATDIESSPIKVGINQFYGIEINDFAVTVAKTALWIAESQMLKETEDIILMHIDFLPLKTNAFIIEGNALRIDWENVLPASQLNYIMGNPPFLGYSMQNESQKKDILEIYVDEKGKTYKTAGKIDYVSGWYFKAAKYIYGTGIKAAFVSTNSITQGEQVASVWKPLYDRFNVNIIFAYKTFIWDSEASQKAHVHCVIVGFSSKKVENPKLYEGNAYEKVQNISPYLVSAPNIFIESRNKPLCSVLPMSTGNRPADGGNLIIEEDEYDEFIKKEPKAVKYIKKLTGAVEYINNKKRYCLWLVGADPSEIRAMPEVMSRIEKCKNDRLNGAADRQKLAATPTIFRETKNPESYIIVPRVSSQNRRYIPIGFLDSETIPTDSATIIEGAREYEFGVLTSNVHMAWMRTVAGRLKSDYRYSKDIVYNNFPWPSPTEEQKAKIEQTAQGILDARALYPNSSLADLYDPLTMPPELQKAHIANDKAVMQAYGFSIKDTSEADCVAALMKMYQELTAEKEK
ncbi:MAG: class I SAM-dependent DNA methyltransferase [Lachnospiraceae bacterium]|nr:class I SAM-dependent DNA methyltransferase [Lachnospiraceae bacterium]